MISSRAIIIMTRYPEPGRVKTRLIPALGADEAARLHRQMVEYAISTVRGFTSASPAGIFVFFNGGSKELMASWLGDGAEYLLQADGNLGDKMRAAFQAVFKRGFKAVTMIGSDCPAIDRHILSRAFSALTRTDMVVGPAVDGGYYLLSIKQVHNSLFEGIHWGGSEVLTQTLSAARSKHLTVSCLPELSDIDRPEDLVTLKDLAAFSSWVHH
ncbi:MAG: TIGR04282 family arsenosugar biosynthesis glycosyltransferase [Deltaproteobacteria bacterium]|nr:TIGR04282 family arsenosugar biosynthesis glycosyltransferase [Candidatus Tharpella sp.]